MHREIEGLSRKAFHHSAGVCVDRKLHTSWNRNCGIFAPPPVAELCCRLLIIAMRNIDAHVLIVG